MLNCPSQHRKENRFVLISTTCAIVGSFYSLMLYTVYPLEVDVEYVFELIYFTWHYSLSCVYASSISYVLLERWKLMNTTISNKFPPCKLVREVATASKINEDQQLKSLENIRFIVDELNETIDLVNSFFSTQMLCCVGITFVIGVGCSFYLFRAFIYRNDQLFMGAINFIWYMYYLSFVLLFIVTASKISDESQRTGIIVHKAINFCHTSRTVVNELMIFSQQLLHYKPIITCGLFAYNGSLLYTMLGATATYLIIMIQFDVSFPSLAIVNSTEPQQL
ncbi:gustatory receptor for bitter taste 66a-like isoform X2 [Armigeres subalbatus]